MLGMAGIHRSSTLLVCAHPDKGGLGMAGIHRSSYTLNSFLLLLLLARDGRDSPLKYTLEPAPALW